MINGSKVVSGEIANVWLESTKDRITTATDFIQVNMTIDGKTIEEKVVDDPLTKPEKMYRIGKTNASLKRTTKYDYLSWTKATNAESYRVYRAKKGSSHYYMYKEYPSANTFKAKYTRTKTKYVYKVVGVKVLHFGNQRFWQFGTLSGPSKVPTTPSTEFIYTNQKEKDKTAASQVLGNFKVKAKKSKYGKSIKIYWTKSTNASGYRIYRSWTTKKADFHMYAEVIGGNNLYKTLTQPTKKKVYYKVVPVSYQYIQNIRLWHFGKLSNYVY